MDGVLLGACPGDFEEEDRPTGGLITPRAHTWASAVRILWLELLLFL
jgi:hypothetical protein